MELQLDAHHKLIWRHSSGRGAKVICDICKQHIAKDVGYLDLSATYGVTFRVCTKCYLSFIIKTHPDWLTEKAFTDMAADQI